MREIMYTWREERGRERVQCKWLSTPTKQGSEHSANHANTMQTTSVIQQILHLIVCILHQLNLITNNYNHNNIWIIDVRYNLVIRKPALQHEVQREQIETKTQLKLHFPQCHQIDNYRKTSRFVYTWVEASPLVACAISVFYSCSCF